MSTSTLCEKNYICGNSQLVAEVLEAVLSLGVVDFCLCPAGRNAPFVYPLVNAEELNIYYWPEERSAAFFALGRIKATGLAAAVVTTSGTAAAELLPAAMEAYYSGLPLILITADRPRRFRGSGAPQSAEQVGLYGVYAEMLDLSAGEHCCLKSWNRQGPIHLNICLEEPKDADCKTLYLDLPTNINEEESLQRDFFPNEKFTSFLQQTNFPFVVIGELPMQDTDAAVHFLLHLKAPVYAEGISGLREDTRLEHLLIRCIDDLWNFSRHFGYPIDGVLRLGGIPTARFWRDLEEKVNEVQVFSVSMRPFSGLSHADVVCTNLSLFFKWASSFPFNKKYSFDDWKKNDRSVSISLLNLFEEEPYAEPSLIHALSLQIPTGSKVYLGNSLPIREWDMAATIKENKFQMACNRGVNGIDGQLASFLGFCTPGQQNWSILGDLTLLYDLAAPWVSSQLLNMSGSVVVVNNEGAGIFKRMFSHPAFQNAHTLNFSFLAEFWGWKYERWMTVPNEKKNNSKWRLIELLPNALSTDRFWQKYKKIK